jgi:hypothetical protein
MAAEESSMQKPLDAVPVAMAPASLPAIPTEERDRLVLKGILKECVAALTAGHNAAAMAALQKLSRVVPPNGGGPMQLVASALGEALSLRAQKLLPPPPPEHIDAERYRFARLYPLLGLVAAAAANHAILQVMEGERDVHVLDLGGANLSQWFKLLRLFAERPGGAPRLRLTVVSKDDAILSEAGEVLAQEAARLQVQFVFNPVRSHIDGFTTADVADPGVERSRQALAITSTLQLHRLIADVTNAEPPAAARAKKGKRKASAPHQITKADALLHDLRALEPKVMLLTEQEADHNGAGLWDRVGNAFDYYAALFSDLKVGGGLLMPADRAVVENLLLQNEIMDIAARDGASRRERHEKMVRWTPRMREAGFQQAQVKFDVYRETARLAYRLSGSGDGNQRLYRVVKDNGCFFLYSRMTLIFSVSVWQPVRSIG